MITFAHYTAEEVKKELQKQLESKRKALTCWEGVKYLTKKDGGAFATLSKNFEGATIERGDRFLSLPAVRVWAGCDVNAWDCEIYIYHYAKDIQDTAGREIVDFDYSGNPYKYLFTIEEIKQADEELKRATQYKTGRTDSLYYEITRTK